MRWTPREHAKFCWHRWFAWHPVTLNSNGERVWLEVVERCWVDFSSPTLSRPHWRYRNVERGDNPPPVRKAERPKPSPHPLRWFRDPPTPKELTLHDALAALIETGKASLNQVRELIRRERL